MLSHHERKNMAISKSGLPQKVLELFDPRDDLEFKRPIRKKRPPALPFIGLGPFVEFFPKPGDPEYQPEQPALATSEERKFRSKEYSAQVSINEPSVLERREAKEALRIAQHKERIEAALAAFDPKSDPNTGESDPMKTLFVSRLDYAVTEAELYAEFEKHGSIKSLKLIKDRAGKSRGYAFVEYNHSGDMKVAYKAYPPDGFVKLGPSGRWSLVDVERGRTVPDWRPMRLGGGKGGEGRRSRPKQVKKGALLAPPGGLAGPPLDRRPPPSSSDYRSRYSGDARPPAPRPVRSYDNGHGDHRPQGGSDRYGGRDERPRERSAAPRDERRPSEYRDRDDRRGDHRSSGYADRSNGDHGDRGRERHSEGRGYGDRGHSHGSSREDKYGKRDRGDAPGYDYRERHGDDRSKRSRHDERDERYAPRDRYR